MNSSRKKKNDAVACTLMRNIGKNYKNCKGKPKHYLRGEGQRSQCATTRKPLILSLWALFFQISCSFIEFFFFFSSLHLEAPGFVRASTSVWVKQTSWIEQTGRITVTGRWIRIPLVMEKRSPAEYVIVSLHICVPSLNSCGSGLVFRGTVSGNGNEIKASAWKFSPDSLHITWLSLLSLRWYNPSAHRQTRAHLNARLHMCMRAQPPTCKHKPPRRPASEWTPAVPYLPFFFCCCCLFRIQLADKAWSRSVLSGCFKSCVSHA